MNRVLMDDLRVVYGWFTDVPFDMSLEHRNVLDLS